MKNFLQKITGLTFALLASFIIGNFASADIIQQEGFVGYSDATSSYSFGVTASPSVYQELVVSNCARETNTGLCEISGIQMPLRMSAYTFTVRFRIYQFEGEGNLYEWGTNKAGLLASSTLLAEANHIHNSASTTNWQTIREYFTGGNIYLIDTEQYFIEITQTVNNSYNSTTVQGYTTVHYFGNLLTKYIPSAYSSQIWNSAQTDYIYGTFLDTDTIIDLADYGGDISWVDEEYWEIMDRDYPDFTSNYNPVCIVGSDCSIWVQYNDYMIDQDIIIYDESSNILDEETITNITSHEIELTIPYTTQASGTLEAFSIYSPVCFAYEIGGIDFSGCGISKGGFNAYWTTAEDYFPDMSIFDNPCFGVATSTGSFSDDFRYGLECGARKTTAWLFQPADSTILRLDNTIATLKGEFPVNVFTQLADVFTISTTTASSTNLIPVLDQNAEIMNYVISQEKIEASDNFYIVTELRKIISIILYFSLGYYIINRLMALARKGNIEKV